MFKTGQIRGSEGTLRRSRRWPSSSGTLQEMKRPQFSLRTLFLITTLIAFYMALYLARQHQQSVALRNAATKAYIGTRAFIEKNSGTWTPGTLDAAIKMLDDHWKGSYSWPVPEYPTKR